MKGIDASSILRKVDLVMGQLEPIVLRALSNAVGRGYARKST